MHAPRDAIRRRIGFVSSKRGEESLARSLTVRENLFINPVTAGAKLLKPMNPGGEHARALRVLHRYSVRPPEPERIIATLSGGNQQKVIVARWMEAGSHLLVLEEPTFGVDVGSKAEIYQHLQKAQDEGLAVLLISSDFEEVAGICHRALIFDRGSVTAELNRAASCRSRGSPRSLRAAKRRRSQRGLDEHPLRQQRPHRSGRAPRISSPSGTWRSCSSC